MKYTLLALLVCCSLEAKFPTVWNRKPARVVDVSKSVPIAGRIPCDGASSPEDHPAVKASFSPGGWERSFSVDVFEKNSCTLDVKGKCLDKHKEGWRETWSSNSSTGPLTDSISLRSCYGWGVNEKAQYVVSGWYREDAKQPWKQAAVKRISDNVYEFADPQGGSGRLSAAFR